MKFFRNLNLKKSGLLLLFLFFLLFSDMFASAQEIYLEPQPALAGEKMDLEVVFPEKISRATAVFGQKKLTRIILKSEEGGCSWRGSYQIPANLKEGEYTFKIYWLPKNAGKKNLKWKIFSWEIISSENVLTTATYSEEELEGYCLTKTPDDPQNLNNLIRYYENNLKYNPDNLPVIKKLYPLYLKNRQPEALTTLEKIVTLKATPYDYLELNRLYLKTGNSKRGQLFYQNLIINQPNVPNHLSGQGHFFLSINDRSKASAVFKKVLQGDPNNLLGILGAGWVALEMGWWADAEKYWEKALKLYPNNPGPPYFWHNYYLVRKNYSGALQSLQTAQQLGFPQNVLLFSALGKVYEKLNQPAKAAEFYEKILKLEPDNAEARLKVGTAAVLTQ